MNKRGPLGTNEWGGLCIGYNGCVRKEPQDGGGCLEFKSHLNAGWE